MDAVELIREGPIAHVWLNQPDRHNALSADLSKGLSDAIHAIAADDSVRVVVLGGRGPSFCAGADIGALKSAGAASFEDNMVEAQRLGGMFAALADLPKPVVGRVHGNALGGGVGLACACDITIVADDATLGLTEVRLGILPALISPYVIRRIGDRTARELMLTGERFKGARSKEFGIAHHVVPVAELDATVAERCGELLKGGPHAQGRIKMLLELWAESGWDEYRAALPRMLAEVRAGDEAKDGLASFLEKRKPRWLG